MSTADARKIAKSSVVLLAENLVRLCAVVAVSFWIARQLGPGEFGILNFASAFMAILLSCSTLGLDTPLILRLTRTESPGAAMGTALFLRIVASVLALALALVIALVLKHGEPVALQVTSIVSLSIVAYSLNTFDFWFKANTTSVAPALARTAATLISVAAKVAVLVMGLGVIALAWTVTLEAAVSGIGLLIAYKWLTWNSAKDRLTVDQTQIRPVLKEGLPYLFSGVAVLMYMKVDVVMLGYLSTNQETGIYSLAQKLSEVLYMVPVVLIDSAYPTLARKFLDSDGNDRAHGQMLFDLAVGGALIAIVVSLVLVGPVIRLLFGSVYLPSIQIFQLHAWSCVAIAMNSARHRWLATTGLQRHAPTVTVVGLVLNLLMNFVLIPAMGAMGAAIATVVSYFVSGYATSYLIPSLRYIGDMQSKAMWPWYRLYKTFAIWRLKNS